MISDRDIIVLSDDWDGHPNSAMHLTRQLLRKNRVFWLNMIGRMPRLTLTDMGKVVRVCRSWARLRGLNRNHNGNGAARTKEPVVATPFVVPWFNRTFRYLNHRSILRAYARLVQRHRITDPIVVTIFPTTVDFVRSINVPVKIYYCVDEWLDYPGVDTDRWRTMEDELLAAVDGIVVTSRQLEKKNQRGCPLLYLPHGVDFEHFHEALKHRKSMPIMERLERPIVGFFGLISQWVDLKLIAALAEAFPQVSFVLIGGATVDPSQIANSKNVHWLGPVPYAELPHFARYFDVGLIPFVRSRLTEAVNPLKLLEYYALGLPVLATRLPELENVPGPLALASTEDEFCEALRGILDRDRDGDRLEGIQIAQSNTWEQRAEQVSMFIESLLQGKPQSASCMMDALHLRGDISA